VAAAHRRAELNPDVRSLAATAAHTGGLMMGSATELAKAVELFADGPRPLALPRPLAVICVTFSQSSTSTRGSS
jgi:hypothetical protein